MTDTPQPLAPSILVIFGVTGDLAHRKLLPALYTLAQHGLLPPQFRIIGVTRRGTTVDALLDKVREATVATGVHYDEAVLAKLGAMLEVHTMDLLDVAAYKSLKARLAAIEQEIGICMVQLFYLAIPAQSCMPVIERLSRAGLHHTCGHGRSTRLLIEKPFGYDLTSARELVAGLASAGYTEDQIYRIDHYLAKETAQNILVFRFQNPIFRQIWDNQHISAITITATEKLGIEGRTGFYEQTGALRDLIQSHLLQLLALAAMDEPGSLAPGAIHERKLQLLKAITPLAPNAVATRTVRGQYTGYRDEVANEDSVTETFAALRLDIGNDRWRGVPVVLQTGKALQEKRIAITVTFNAADDQNDRNILTIRIQPNEGIHLTLLAKKPGLTSDTQPVQMDFSYGQSFDGMRSDDSYARVLLDAFRGDKTLFATSEEVLACWRIVEPVLHEWAKNDNGLQPYAPGTSGPAIKEIYDAL